MKHIDKKPELIQFLELLKQIEQYLKDLDKKVETLNKPREVSEKGASLRELLSIEDIQEILEVSLTTAVRFVREGVLPRRQIGSRYYFYEQDIHDVLTRKWKDENSEERDGKVQEDREIQEK